MALTINERFSHFAVRRGVRCAGVHLLLDIYGSDPRKLDDPQYIRQVLHSAAQKARATVMKEEFHRFEPCGVSGMLILAESHLSIHTWPREGIATLDMFMCGNADPHAALPIIEKAFDGQMSAYEVLRAPINPQTSDFDRRMTRLTAV